MCTSSWFAPGWSGLQPQDRLVKGHFGNAGRRIAHITGPAIAAQSRAGKPSLLVVLIKGNQFIERADSRLPALVVIGEFPFEPFLLQAGGDQAAFAIAAFGQQGLRFFQRLVGVPAPFLHARLKPHQAIAQSGSNLAAVSNERAASIQT